MSQLTERQQRLLALIHADGGVTTVTRVHALNRTLGAPKKATARRDVTDLRRHGLLDQRGTDDDRYYILTRKATT